MFLLIFKNKTGFLGLEVETKARILLSLDLGSTYLLNSVKGMKPHLAMQLFVSDSGEPCFVRLI